MTPNGEAPAPVARINGVALHPPKDILAPEVLRQRACTELLRQAAQRCGLLAPDDPPGTDGAISQEATDAIEALLARTLDVPEPSEEACRRHHAAHAAAFGGGERARARHILFAVTPGVDVVALRKRAEAALIDVRCHDGVAGDRFAPAARALSNCPTGAQGGDLGWISVRDCAPEFAAEIFGKPGIGVLPRLVHSRFGLHVVEVLEREPGATPEFAEVRGAVVAALRQQGFVTALRGYLDTLATSAEVDGIDLAEAQA
jgi:peptidyl-prolyl cis-trans isomerase C